MFLIIAMDGCENIENAKWGEATGEPDNSVDAVLSFVCNNGYKKPDNAAICVYGEEKIFWNGDTECPSFFITSIWRGRNQSKGKLNKLPKNVKTRDKNGKI